MGARVGDTGGGPMADINVTPLVDVVLVLLIIFMVITPMLSSGIDVKLPIAHSATTTQDVGQHLAIGIREDGKIFVDTTESSLATLVDDVNVKLRENPGRSLLVKGASTLRYGQVREVTDMLAANGATMILIATDKPDEPKPEAK